jgi:hypothetical protein
MAQSDKNKQPDSPPPRRNWAGPVSRDAQSTGGSALSRAGFSDPTLILRWGEIAGAEIARIAQPIKLSEGAAGAVLTLRAEPGASVFLQHESRALCGRINNFLGPDAVARLRFVDGAVTQRTNRPPSPRRNAHLSPDDPAVAFQAKDSLKEAVMKLAKARKTGGKPGN